LCNLSNRNCSVKAAAKQAQLERKLSFKFDTLTPHLKFSSKINNQKLLRAWIIRTRKSRANAKKIVLIRHFGYKIKGLVHCFSMQGCNKKVFFPRP